MRGAGRREEQKGAAVRLGPAGLEQAQDHLLVSISVDATPLVSFLQKYSKLVAELG